MLSMPWHSRTHKAHKGKRQSRVTNSSNKLRKRVRLRLELVCHTSEIRANQRVLSREPSPTVPVTKMSVPDQTHKLILTARQLEPLKVYSTLINDILRSYILRRTTYVKTFYVERSTSRFHTLRHCNLRDLFFTSYVNCLISTSKFI